MSISKYMAFLKTVEYGSFTKAAQILDYTQSGISHMINDLEKEWKISLLERSRAGVQISSDGLKLLPLIREICELQKKLDDEIDELHGVQSGLIRIGTFSSVASRWLPNMIKTFQLKYPNIEFELLIGYYNEIEQWISEGRVDFGFLKLPTRPDFETIFLEKDKLMVILQEGHPLAECEKFPVKALNGAPFMLLEKEGKFEISEVFEKNNVMPNVRFTTLDDYAIMAMVESGLGISILHELILQRIPYNIIKKELDIPAYREIGIAMKDYKSTSNAVKRFLSYLPYRNKIEG